MRKLFKYFRPELFIATLGIIFVGGSAFIELYQIRLMAGIIDIGIANADFSIVNYAIFKGRHLAIVQILQTFLFLNSKSIFLLYIFK